MIKGEIREDVDLRQYIREEEVGDMVVMRILGREQISRERCQILEILEGDREGIYVKV